MQINWDKIEDRFNYHQKVDDKEAYETQLLLNNDDLVDMESLGEYQSRKKAFRDGWDKAINVVKREIKKLASGEY